MAKPTARTVTPPTARVPPTAAAKSGANKGSSENNVQQAQIDDLSNQVCVLGLSHPQQRWILI